MVKKKSKMLKKIMAFFLATLILCSSIPMQVFAAGINLGQQVSRTTINVKAEKKYGHEIHTTKVNGETYPLFCIEYGKSSPTSSTLGSQGRPSDEKLLKAAEWIFAGYYMEHGNNIDYLDMAYCQKKVWSVLGDNTSWTFSNEGYEKWCDNAERNMKELNTKPSFDGNNIGSFVAGKTYTITDTNGVLKDYPAFVQDENGIRIEHKANSNSLTITIDKNCTRNNFRLKGNIYKTITGDDDECLLYNPKAGGTQKLMYSAYYDPVAVDFRGEVISLGNVELTKEDRFNGKIDGAKFGIYTDRNCTNRVATAVSKDGKIVFDYLEPKTYFIKEISAPQGFLLSDTVAEITVRSNQTSYITINNDEPKGKIELTKELDTYKTDGMHGDVNINGAEYTLYADEDIKSAIGSKTFYNKGDVVQVGKVSSNYETVASCTFNDLPLGKYMLKETKAPEGTLLDKTEYKIELKYKDQTTEVILNNTTSTDAVKSMKVQIFKSGSDGSAGQVQGLEGAEFTIKLKSDYDNAVKQGYKTEEIWSFKEGSKWVGVNDKNQKVEVDGTKAEKAQEIAPTYDVITTNKNGFAVSKYLPYGKYIVKETKTPINYTSGADFIFSIKNDESEFENVEDKLIYINVNNAPVEYPVKIVKKDKESGKTVSLNSAKFKIKATENIYNTTTGQIIFAKGDYVEYKIGSAKYNTFMTNSDNFVVPTGNIYGTTNDDKGTVTTPFKLPAGHYEIVEFETPQGFLVPEEKYEFEISTIYDYDQDQDGDTVVVVEVKNSQPKGNVNLQKAVELRPDVDTSVIKVDFTKVKFELVAAKDIIDMADGQVIYKAGDKVGEYNLDAEGKLSIKNLWIGEYYLQEVETMDGAVLDYTKYSVIFTAEDTTTKEYTVNLNVVNKTTEVDITKVDVTGSNEIEGAELVVYDKAGNIIDKWTSGKEAHKIEGLVVGNTYILHEEYAPNGYTIATDIEFTVGNTSEIQKVNMIDKQVAVTKVDENNKALAGAELVITNIKTKQIVDKWTSTEELHYVSGLIEGQTYILAEVQAPYGYEITKEIEFTVTQDKELQTIQMQDTPIYASVQVEKVDAQTGENIKSNKFEFTIFADEQCTQEIKTVNANTKEGTALFEKLTYGTYYIKETKAPKGYELSDEVVKIDINDKGVFANGNQLTEENGVYSFKYQNSLLPIIATGDNPMMYVYVAGVLILGVAIIVLIKKKVGKNNNKK